MDFNEKLEAVGLTIPKILLPNEHVDLNKFSCIAADQYTQDLEYWDDVKEYIGDAKSSYNLIFPEAYLEHSMPSDKSAYDVALTKKIQDINDTMSTYIDDGVLKSIGNCFVYVERFIGDKIRKGLIVAIDLEKYNYEKGSKSLIRATELTVKDRLIVRKKIREHARLDLPHILVLINDKENLVFDEVNKSIKKENLLYDFELMKKGGHIRGTAIRDEHDIERIADALITIKNESEDGLLYAVGDGNHSLAAAKDSYMASGKGRFALVELINIYDSGLSFYPIHRLLTNVDRDNFHRETGIDEKNPMPLQELQEIIDKYMSHHKDVKLDYIHGKDECEKLGKSPQNLAITYDHFSHETLFSDVVKHGALCRKSFSMGEANDKRFYLESMEIVQ